MKILQIHNHYQCKGGEDAVVAAEKALLENNGHSVIQYLRHNDEVHHYNGIKKINLFINAIWSANAGEQVKTILENERPDVAHFHNTLPLISPAAYYACRKAKVPVVQTLHNYRLLCPSGLLYRDSNICEQCLEHSLARAVLYGCYRNSRLQTFAVALMLALHRQAGTWNKKVDAYIALTTFMKDKFVGYGFPAEKIFVKPNAVQTPLNCSGPDRGDYALFLGRLSREKGLMTLLKAFKTVPEARLKIAGDGSYGKELIHFVRENNLTNVAFTGYLEGAELADLILKAGFVIHSSECYEGFPLTIAEAFSAGKPVIASRLGAMAEIIRHGKTGLHYTPGDSADLAGRLSWALSHHKEMREMGLAARNEYENKYTAQKNYKQLMEVYQSVVGIENRRNE